MLNCEGGSSVLCYSRNVSRVLLVWLCGRSSLDSELCFPGCIYETLLLRSCLSPTHICRRWRQREHRAYDKLRSVFLSFLQKRRAVWRHYGAWFRRSICWDVGGTVRKTCVEVVFAKVSRSLVSPLEFPVFFLWLHWIFQVFPQMLLKGRKSQKNLTGNITGTKLPAQWKLNSCIMDCVLKREKGKSEVECVWIWYLLWVMWVPAGKSEVSAHVGMELLLSPMVRSHIREIWIKLSSRDFRGLLATFTEEGNQSLSYSPAAECELERYRLKPWDKRYIQSKHKPK